MRRFRSAAAEPPLWSGSESGGSRHRTPERAAFIWLLLTLGCGPGSEVKTGRELYLAYGCAACHGDNADGNGFSAPLSAIKPRDLRDVRQFAGAKTAEGIAATIAFGVADGRTGMPAYPDIPKRERLAIAEYILSLEPGVVQPSGVVQASRLPPGGPTEGRPEARTTPQIRARASHPMQTVAVAYVVSLPAAITAVTTPAARVVELHEMKTVDGVMRMNKVEKIGAPPAEGAHLMLIDLIKPLRAGDTIELTLTFENGSRETIEASVRDED